MWQKAKIVRAKTYPQLLGRCIWVRCGKPEEMDVIERYTHKRGSGLGVYCNLTNRGQEIVQPIQALELLPEFADTVDHITWDEFVRGE